MAPVLNEVGFEGSSRTDGENDRLADGIELGIELGWYDGLLEG